MNSKLKTLLISALLLFSTAINAQTEANQFFSHGMVAAKEGNYELAIENFRQARRLGKDSDAILYNLGVCFYKIEDYNSALTWFELLLRSAKNRPLALYNLGLTNARLGNEIVAVRWFQRAMKTKTNKKVQLLAARQIRILYAAKKTEVEEKKKQKTIKSNQRIFAGARLDFGWDDNILYPETSDSTGEGDLFTQYFTWGKLRAVGDHRWGINLRLSAYGTTYQNASDFDRTVFNGGIAPYIRLNQWTYEVGLSEETSQLGSQDYLAVKNYYFSARKYIKPGTTALLKYSFDDLIAGDSGDFDYLEGQRQRLGFSFYNKNDNFRYILKYNVEKNNRADRVIDQYFFSYSPFRQSLSLAWEQTWYSRIVTSQEIGYRYSQYRDANLFQENGALERRTRKDERISVQLGAAYLFSEDISVELRYSANRSQSNFAFYEFDQNLISVSLKASL